MAWTHKWGRKCGLATGVGAPGTVSFGPSRRQTWSWLAGSWFWSLGGLPAPPSGLVCGLNASSHIKRRPGQAPAFPGGCWGSIVCRDHSPQTWGWSWKETLWGAAQPFGAFSVHPCCRLGVLPHSDVICSLGGLRHRRGCAKGGEVPFFCRSTFPWKCWQVLPSVLRTAIKLCRKPQAPGRWGRKMQREGSASSRITLRWSLALQGSWFHTCPMGWIHMKKWVAPGWHLTATAGFRVVDLQWVFCLGKWKVFCVHLSPVWLSRSLRHQINTWRHRRHPTWTRAWQ